jgi:hypothetical protein
LLLLGAHFSVAAETTTERLDTTLSLRSDVWSGSRQLDDAGGLAQASAWGSAKLDLDAAGTVAGSGWLREQSRKDYDTPRGRVRELYWRYNKEPVELRIGRQMVVWGRADGVNPTDNLSPRDFTLLAPEDGDLRYGNEVTQLIGNTGIGNFSGLFFPHAASHTIPLPPQPNVSYAVEKPHQSQWALKWEASGNGIDGSLSYFNGIDPMPDLNPGDLGPGGVTIAVRNHPARILGGDLSLSHNGVIWRAEAAWMQTDSTGSDDFIHKKPQVSLVAGPEWTLGDNTTFGIQGTLQRVIGFQNPDTISEPITREIAWRQAATSNQFSATQTGLTWRLARRWWNDTLLTETSGVAVWRSGSGVWRTKADYALNDHWYLQAGTDYYFGPEHSFFGQLSKNRLLYVQLRYSL